MLVELHVRNLALIEKADVEFDGGLNILTGETGAGKSIIIGSVTAALGGKSPRDMIRQGAEYAYIELLFSVTDREKRRALEELDVRPSEDGTLIVSKKIMVSRSVSKINDETVTNGRLREITGILIDVHGQHEHQSLLNKSKHLDILDKYIRNKSQELKQNIADSYRLYASLKKKLESFLGDRDSRLREADFLRFEIGEIEGARLKEGEEEELAARHRRFSNSRKIMECLAVVHEAAESELIGRAVREAAEAAKYDGALDTVRDQLYDVEAVMGDVSREITVYLDALSYDEGELANIEARLDTIHNLLAKYGKSVEETETCLEDKKKRLEELENYDQIRQKTEEEFCNAENKLRILCGQLSEVRKKAAGNLTKKIKSGLIDLNFIDVEFAMEFRRKEHFTEGGWDEAEFLITTNPGEPMKPLSAVASGGELSRIMLAIKTVLADSDDIPTLIFDEIDTGISGRTAQKVSEKLAYISKNHQVICITHLPQIASMADTHFEILKSANGQKTTTQIRKLEGEEVVAELARMLGGAKITDTVLKNAREMKELADSTK